MSIMQSPDFIPAETQQSVMRIITMSIWGSSWANHFQLQKNKSNIKMVVAKGPKRATNWTFVRHSLTRKTQILKLIWSIHIIPCLWNEKLHYNLLYHISISNVKVNAWNKAIWPTAQSYPSHKSNIRIGLNQWPLLQVTNLFYNLTQ